MMSYIITGNELFKSGRNHFGSNKDNQTLKNRVNEIKAKSGIVRSMHRTGSPNESKESTTNGAAMASKSLVEGICLNDNSFNRNEDNLFGENIKEAMHRLKRFFC